MSSEPSSAELSICECPSALETPNYGKPTAQDVTRASSLSSMLEIQFELGNCKGIPAGGIGLYEGRKVLFLPFMKRGQEEYPKVDLLLYQLKEEHLQLVEAEQERFREEVGTVRDYDCQTVHMKIKTEMVNGEKKQIPLRFGYNYRIQDLDVILLGKLNYSQIKNPFPSSYGQF